MRWREEMRGLGGEGTSLSQVEGALPMQRLTKGQR